MIKKSRRVMALILAVSFVLSSCGAGNTGGGEGSGANLKGAYVEEVLYEIEGDNKYLSAAKLTDGDYLARIVNIDTQKGENITSTDGKTWNTMETMKKFHEENPNMSESYAAFSSSGKLYAIFYKHEGEGAFMGEGKPLLYVFEADGETYKEIDLMAALDLKEGETPMINSLIIPREDRVFLNYNINSLSSEVGGMPVGGIISGGSAEVSVVGEAPATEEAPLGEESVAGEEETPSDFSMSSMGPGELVATLINPETGEKVADLELPEDAFYGNWIENSSHIYFCMDMDGVSATAYSLEDGSEDSEKSIKAQRNNGSWNQSYYVDDKGDLYWINTDGINHVVSGGTVVETLFSSSGFVFSLDTAYISKLTRNEDGSFLILLGGAVGYKIVKYTYDENFDPGELTTVRVYSLIKDTSINHAIIALKKSNPSILIDYEIAFPDAYGLSGISETDLESALRLLNTEILTGEGPDVVIMDGLDIDNFVEKGFLLPLDGLVDTSGVYENVVKALNPGETFVVPSKITVPIFLGAKEDVEDVNTLDEFINAAISKPKNAPAGENMFEPEPIKQEDRAYFTAREINSLFELFFTSHSNMIIGKDGINEENLRNLFETLKKYADYNGIKDGEGMGMGGVSMSSSTGMGGIKISGSLAESMIALNGGQSLSAMHDVDGFMYMLDLISSKQNEINTINNIPGAEGNVFKPSSILAINKQSKNPALAAEIINELLSFETQMAIEFALPVREDALIAQMDMIDKYFEVQNAEIKDSSITPEIIAGFKAPMLEYLNSLDTAANTNTTVQNIILEAYSEYMAGTLTIDEAIDKIKEATKFYFAEK